MDIINYNPADWTPMETHPKVNGWYDTVSLTGNLGKIDGPYEKKYVLGVSLFRDGKWVDTPYKNTFGWKESLKMPDGDAQPLSKAGALSLAETILSDISDEFRKSYRALMDVGAGADQIYSYATQERVMKSRHVSILSMGAASGEDRVIHNCNAVLREKRCNNVDKTREKINEIILDFHRTIHAEYEHNRALAGTNKTWQNAMDQWNECVKESLAADTLKEIRRAVREG